MKPQSVTGSLLFLDGKTRITDIQPCSGVEPSELGGPGTSDPFAVRAFFIVSNILQQIQQFAWTLGLVNSRNDQGFSFHSNCFSESRGRMSFNLCDDISSFLSFPVLSSPYFLKPIK